MNRKERRAAAKRAPAGGTSSSGSAQASIAAAFAQAARQHQAGEWFAAEATCRAILARDPKHVGSLHLLGVMAQQRGQFEEAAAHFRGMVDVRPDLALAHHSLGGALAAAGRLEEAVPAFERAMALKAGDPAAPVPEAAESLLVLGNLYARLGRAEMAAERFKRALALKPEFAQAHNDYGAMLLAQGKLKDASAQFALALELAPELLQNFSAVNSMLLTLNPALGEGLARANAAWPELVPAGELFGPGGLAAVAGDPLLRCVLQSAPVRDIAIERFLTSVRAAALKQAADAPSLVESLVDEATLSFCCALARQCFINEYVFAVTPGELEQVEVLKRTLIEALDQRAAVPAPWLAAVASYLPLSSLPDQQTILDRTWPEAIQGLLTQQVREVRQERELRDSFPRLTAIEDATSALVRQQYEENPYPRWVLPPSRRPPVAVDEYLTALFPWAPFRPLGQRNGVDILVAGCGTGEHPIGMARRFAGARVLAVDLSLTSLCYAQRKTRELALQNIEYAQADILKLGSLGRSFDVIDAGGVLHHLADPAEGWQQLLTLLRPGGFMRIGLYSELGRADVVAARRFIDERGFRPTAADIRRCRQEMLGTPLQALTRYHDFFSTSECRDLLFHVQERRFAIPEIKAFLADRNLRFIGFEVDADIADAYRARFPGDRAMTDLDCWHAFESERPGTFAAMYKFWCQS